MHPLMNHPPLIRQPHYFHHAWGYHQFPSVEIKTFKNDSILTVLSTDPVDFSILDNRISGSIVAFNKETKQEETLSYNYEGGLTEGDTISLFNEEQAKISFAGVRRGSILNI